MNEIWKPIVGMETHYDVSNAGRVRSRRGIRCLSKSEKGYLKVMLSGNGIQRTVFVHRLVLEAFIGPKPSTFHQTNHKDGNKANNSWTNLEWVTPSQNIIHAVRNGLRGPVNGEQHGKSAFKDSDIYYIRNQNRKVRGMCVNLAKHFAVCTTTISNIWNRKTWKHLKSTPTKE